MNVYLQGKYKSELATNGRDRNGSREIHIIIAQTAGLHTTIALPRVRNVVPSVNECLRA